MTQGNRNATDDGELQQPEVLNYRSVDELNDCSYHDPEDGVCLALSDYVLAVEYDGEVSVLGFCEEHANVGDEEVNAE